MVTAIASYAVLLSACSTTTSGAATVPGTPSAAAEPTISKSTIVSQMENYYEENPELPIDPCHDSFIRDMEKLGYILNAEVILPRGEMYFGYWYAECQYKSDTLSAMVESSTGPFMLPNESLEPEFENKGLSSIIDINGRESIVRPSANWGSGCFISITTSFGSMTIYGGESPHQDHEVDCQKILELVHQIEPWIND